MSETPTPGEGARRAVREYPEALRKLADAELAELREAAQEELTGRRADGRLLMRNWTLPAASLRHYIAALEARLSGAERNKEET